MHEGQTVQSGALLARLDDTDAVLSLDKAKLEREIADKQASDDVKLRFAKKALEVATAEEQRGHRVGREIQQKRFANGTGRIAAHQAKGGP